MRVGVFGGAFNPPHVGHLVCAGEALWQLELDRVLFMPVGEAPHRRIELDPGREQRFELCALAVQGEPGFDVSRLEIEKQGPCYTVETLEGLRQSDAGRELVLIVGGDQAATLRQWRSPERILELAELAVAERERSGREQIATALEGLAGIERVRYFDMPAIDVSSSMVRERIASGRPFRHLLSERVGDRIAREGLYQERAAV